MAWVVAQVAVAEAVAAAATPAATVAGGVLVMAVAVAAMAVVVARRQLAVLQEVLAEAGALACATMQTLCGQSGTARCAFPLCWRRPPFMLQASRCVNSEPALRCTGT